jgi:hypothetical protein
MPQSDQVKGFVNNIVAGAVWDGIKQLWGPAVIAVIVAVWGKLKHGSLDWVAIIGMFLVASALAFLNFRKPKQFTEPKSQQWKPAWQRLQSCNAERQRLEGELSEARKPDTSLRARTIATCDELMDFLREHGPKPEIPHERGETDAEWLFKTMAVLDTYKGKMGADFRLRFSDPVKRIRDEIQVQCGMSERPLDKAIEIAESQLCEPKFVEEIRDCLWRFAATMSR